MCAKMNNALAEPALLYGPKNCFCAIINCRVAIMFFLSICFASFGIAVKAQYDNVTDYYDLDFIGAPPMFANGLSFYDFNKDGLDDLTFCSNLYGVFTYVNTGDGFENIDLFSSIDGDLKHPIWVDYDNDGDADFFASRALEELVLMRNDGDLVFTDVSDLLWMPFEGYMTMGCTWGDYNEDGFLDLYVGNYHQGGQITNWLFRNNQDGTFTEWAGVLGIDNGVKPAYQTLFVDYDTDGDMDLVVINDKHKGNFIYQNNNGEFTDISVASGFYTPCNGMSATTCDYDHDGDFDFYVSNTEQGNKFYRNDDSIFVDIAPDVGAACYGFCWGAVWLDTNNDLTEDLFVTAGSEMLQENYYFANESQNEDYSTAYFSDSPDIDLPSYAVAKGDMNNDGFYDLAMSHIIPVQATLWHGPANTENSWIKVSLQGTLSNRDGIGALVHCYAGDDHVVRQLLCGENFLSQDSQHLIIGMGGHTMIDSLIINWPKGWTDSFYNLPVNVNYDFIEGETVAELNTIEQLFVCPNDSLFLDLGNVGSVVWENGDTSTSRWIYQQGEFVATIVNDFGFSFTNQFLIDTHVVPEILYNTLMPSCHGSSDGEIVLVGDDQNVNAVFWNDVAGTSVISGLSSGIINCKILLENSCIVEEEILVSQPEQLNVVAADTMFVCSEQSSMADVQVFGGTGAYSIEWSNGSSGNLAAGLHTFVVTDANSCVVADSIQVVEFPQLFLQLSAEPMCDGATTSIVYQASGGEGTYTFDFDDFDPEVVSEGEYTVVVADENFCSAQESISIESLPPLQIELTTINPQGSNNGSIEVEVDGGQMPYQFLWNNGDSDYLAQDLVQGYYECLITDALGCTLEFGFNLIDIAIDEQQNHLLMYPIPFNDVLNLESTEPMRIAVFNAEGKLLFEKKMSGYESIDTTNWSVGAYFIIDEEHQRIWKVQKQN